MAFTGLATKVYKDPLTVQWMNSIKGNFDHIGPHGVWAWIKFDGSGVGTSVGSYNVSDVTRTGAGLYKITFSTGFANTAYACNVSSNRTGQPAKPNVACAYEYDTGTVNVSIIIGSIDSAGDGDDVNVLCVGTGTGV